MKNHIVSTILPTLSFIVFFLFKGILVSGQVDSFAIAVSMKPQEFDKWISRKCDYYIFKKSFSADTINQVIVTRFNSGYYTSIEAIFTALKLNNFVGFFQNESYEPTIVFIDTLLNVVDQNDFLKVKLLEKKAYLLQNSPWNSDIERKALKHKVNETNECLIDILTPVNLELRITEAKCLAELGCHYSEISDKKNKADAYLIQALKQATFWTIEQPQAFEAMRSAYISAGLCRLKLYFGDLNGLKQLSFAPSTYEELYPTWKIYFEAAGGDWEKFWNED